MSNENGDDRDEQGRPWGDEAEPVKEDAGDREKVKAAEKKRKLARRLELENLRKMLSTYEGREFVWRLLERCGVSCTSFRGEDTHRMAFQEGQRNVGLWTTEEVLTAYPETYTIMRDEAVSRDTPRKGK